MLSVLDTLLTLFHTGFTLFNLTGWIWRRTRKAHLITLTLTVVSWLLIGLFYGVIGYCPITDWHWDIKRELGETQLPNSFMKYILDRAFNYDFSSTLVDSATGIGLFMVIALSVWLNWRDQFSNPG
ncbi:MAG: DUF2784 domain-containing protein [Cyclobacteriaceae bacterium]